MRFGQPEFRVLKGKHAGCRLLLKPGSYRVGGDDSCDVLIEASSRAVFLLHIDEQGEIILEPISAAIRLGQTLLSASSALTAGQVFSVDDMRFCVDEMAAEWPSAIVLDDERREPVIPACAQDAAAQPQDVVEPEPQPVACEEATVASTASPIAEKRRFRPPFWVVWLSATVCFLFISFTFLFLSLRTEQASGPLAPVSSKPALERIVVASRAYASLELSQLPNKRWKLTGFTQTRSQRIELIKQIRAIAPSAQIQVDADEEMMALARETLGRFADIKIEGKAMRFGRLELKGKASSVDRCDALAMALLEDIPRLQAIRSDIAAPDEAFAALRNWLVDSPLGKVIAARWDKDHLVVQGVIDEHQERQWQALRSRLTRRFGEGLKIMEQFQHSLPRRDNIVLAVGGHVPYVLLSDGVKEGRSSSAIDYAPRQDQ